MKCLQLQYDHIKVTDFGREQSSKINEVATKYVNQNGLIRKEYDIHMNYKEITLFGKDMLGRTRSGGSALSEGKYIGNINYERASDAVRHFNSQIKNEEVENVVVIDKLGNVFQFIENTNSVSFDSVNLEGTYITHNYLESNVILSFGKNDFEFLKAH